MKIIVTLLVLIFSQISEAQSVLQYNCESVDQSRIKIFITIKEAYNFKNKLVTTTGNLRIGNGNYILNQMSRQSHYDRYKNEGIVLVIWTTKYNFKLVGEFNPDLPSRQFNAYYVGGSRASYRMSCSY